MYGRALSGAEGRQSSSARKRYQLTAPWCDTAQRTRSACCCVCAASRRLGTQRTVRTPISRGGAWRRRPTNNFAHTGLKIARQSGSRNWGFFTHKWEKYRPFVREIAQSGNTEQTANDVAFRGARPTTQ
ncbi:hypothetical protein NDU88_001460 [Pleurodeles waltl]|uniref:Uncharacterized protein n=1 Tax=Pleurodeles waltl TaxID=8319 RepID=A0AAV7M185_PLEWA|nr:hypothetical protein NDU88_001460 [Pleurodeles waltl]